ncbi:MAG: hypothetical protein AAF236_09530 [Verrucomicrobiota bacterium]
MKQTSSKNEKWLLAAIGLVCFAIAGLGGLQLSRILSDRPVATSVENKDRELDPLRFSDGSDPSPTETTVVTAPPVSPGLLLEDPEVTPQPKQSEGVATAPSSAEQEEAESDDPTFTSPVTGENVESFSSRPRDLVITAGSDRPISRDEGETFVSAEPGATAQASPPIDEASPPEIDPGISVGGETPVAEVTVGAANGDATLGAAVETGQPTDSGSVVIAGAELEINPTAPVTENPEPQPVVAETTVNQGETTDATASVDYSSALAGSVSGLIGGVEAPEADSRVELRSGTTPTGAPEARASQIFVNGRPVATFTPTTGGNPVIGGPQGVGGTVPVQTPVANPQLPVPSTTVPGALPGLSDLDLRLNIGIDTP